MKWPRAASLMAIGAGSFVPSTPAGAVTRRAFHARGTAQCDRVPSVLSDQANAGADCHVQGSSGFISSTCNFLSMGDGGDADVTAALDPTPSQL